MERSTGETFFQDFRQSLRRLREERESSVQSPAQSRTRLSPRSPFAKGGNTYGTSRSPPLRSPPVPTKKSHLDFIDQKISDLRNVLEQYRNPPVPVSVSVQSEKQENASLSQILSQQKATWAADESREKLRLLESKQTEMNQLIRQELSEMKVAISDVRDRVQRVEHNVSRLSALMYNRPLGGTTNIAGVGHTVESKGMSLRDLTGHE